MRTESFGELSGQDWEDVCNKLFHARYKDNYQEVPARYGGDYGVEGFTFDGQLFQCYSPKDEEFSSKTLYELQRDKITKDINKLIKNILEIRKLNKNQNIQNWHFVTPAFDNKDLHEHCRKKEEEIQTAIGQFINNDFKIMLQTENSYITEIGYLVNSKILQIQSTNKSYTEDELQLISQSDNEIVNKIRTKLQKLDSLKENENTLNKYTYLVFRFFIEGQEELEMLNKSYPDIFQGLSRLKNSIEKKVELKSMRGIDLKDLEKIQEEYKSDLEKGFKDICEISLLENLAQEAIADWMARCPIDFD
ncbi:MAG: hypothetical protein CL623_08250 [Arcobacter sp.]|nr:hypothetical protein [Arcobacter sp.]|tara:strand:- start:7304 stop:8221 length:918 start_codon:yes stop_codon:yes gene_type:complete